MEYMKYTRRPTKVGRCFVEQENIYAGCIDFDSHSRYRYDSFYITISQNRKFTLNERTYNNSK